MATMTRQPFAPLDGSRLQSLTSMKNRQNALPGASPSNKRKVEQLDVADAENIDPLLFAKRSKSGESTLFKNSIVKPSNYILATKPTVIKHSSNSTPYSPPTTLRRIATPRSPSAKLLASVKKPMSLTAPAGRSPSRGKRAGLLGSSRRRRTLGRIDPPSFNLGLGGGGGNAAPFSLDAALKGTIPGYTPRFSAKPSEPPSVVESPMNPNWFFDIHEDTPEQEMTNLLQHSTCTLDISSDEESEQRAKRETKENKENVPPVDDVSQTTSARTHTRLRGENEMIVEKQRVALGEMDVKSFYPPDCDAESVIYIPEDEDAGLPLNASSSESGAKPTLQENISAIQEKANRSLQRHISKDSQTPLQQGCSSLAKSKLSIELELEVQPTLKPIEGAGESFELWESASAKDEEQTAGDIATTS